jgi:Ca-activated chloride channel family protein
MRLPFFIDLPWLLVLALVLPAIAVTLLVLAVRRRKARLARLGTESMLARLAADAPAPRARWRAARLGLALAFSAIALAGPRWGSERTVVRGEGIDLVLCLDASSSMLATDERPSRLEKLKQEVRRLRALSSADRIALIAFAGRSYILTPLTVDDGALDLFLDNLDPTVVGQAGSSIARTIRQGTELLVATKTGSDRALVVMSDGEAFEAPQEVEEAARAAAEAGVSLVTVGFGTLQGSTIPVRDDRGAVTEKRDDNGEVVVTRYVPDLLRAAATAANGTFVPAEASDKAARVRSALSTLRRQARVTEAGREQTPRFQLFLIPAVLLVLLDTWLAERRRKRRGFAAPGVVTARRAASVGVAIALTLAPAALRADDATDAGRAYQAKRYGEAARLYRRALEKSKGAPRDMYNLGTALLAADSLAAAAELLQRVATARLTDDPQGELRFRALFNLGLAGLRRGLSAQGDQAEAALNVALAAYKRALILRPTDRDAKWNYELALKKKQSGGGGGGGGEDDKQPDQQRQPDPKSAPQPQPRPAGGLGQQQADQLLNSAARDEREVQGKKQKQNRAEPPPGGKDW